MTDILIDTAHQDVGAVLDRLNRFCKDWHESRLPPSVRAQGVYGCRFRLLEGGAFDLRLVPQGRGVPTRCRGQIERSTDGSLVLATVEPTPWGLWGGVACAAILGTIWAIPQLRTDSPVAALGRMGLAATLVLVTLALNVSASVNRYRPVYRAILEQGLDYSHQSV